MGERQKRVEAAFLALERGDLGPFRALLDADAKWLGVPGSGWEGETPT
jgi:hypothetical protein